jgi:hypothetical protein
MKFYFIHLIFFTLIASCTQDTADVVVLDYKSNNISQYIDSSEVEPINETWVEQDSLFLSELQQTLVNDEKNVLNIFQINSNKRRTNLGFGYKQIESSMGKGYVSIFYNLIIKNGRLISYQLTPEFPSNTRLTERYIKIYSNIFRINNDTIYNRYYNLKKTELPLNKLKSDVSLNQNLQFLMTPFSGTMYGYSGGYGNVIFLNRSIFIKERERITPEVCQTLMTSINPSTRFMAIEHYLKNKSEFDKTDRIDTWIEKVYMELPIIVTLDGCLGTQRYSRDLVQEYVNK